MDLGAGGVPDAALRRALQPALESLPVPTLARVPDDASAEARAWSGDFDCAPESADDHDAALRGVLAHPLAAQTLVQLWRGGAGRTLAQGLAAESWAYATLQAGPEFAAWLATRRAPRPDAAPVRPVLRVERRDDVLDLCFDRPEKRNAFDARMRDALCEALALAALDPEIGRIALRGEGPDFCSGGDLDEFGSRPDPTTAHAVRTTRSPARWLAELGSRVEARVHGACFGAGIELPAFAARVVAHPGARFCLPELALGLIPGAGGSVSLPRRIGRQRSAWLALSGSEIGAERALAWGLVDALEA